MSMINHRLLGVILVTIFLLMGTALISSGNANAWNVNVNLEPNTVTEGDTVNFEVYLINTGSDSMRITYVGVHFDWMDSGYYYVSDEVSKDNPYILKSGDSVAFHINGVPIPNGISTHTYHSYDLVIEAADPGIIFQWGWTYSKTYHGSVFVEEPTYKIYGYVQDSSTGNPIGGAKVTIGGYTTTTNTYGYYSIDNIKRGTYTITVEASGYHSSSKVITISGNTKVNFDLSPLPSNSGGVSNPGSGGNNYGIIFPLTIFLIVLIVVIIVVVTIVSSRKKNTSATTPPPTPPNSEIQQKTEPINTKFCPYCGREIPGDAIICPYCGKKLGGDVENE